MANEKLKICNEKPKGKNHLNVSGNVTSLLSHINGCLMKICTKENVKFSLASIRAIKFLSPVKALEIT